MRPGSAYRILRAERLAPTIAQLVVRAPLVARKRRAGQFVIVRLEQAGERIPLTIVDADPDASTITLVVQAVGKTTRQLAARRAGEAIADVLGPLGNPTPIERHGEGRASAAAWARRCCCRSRARSRRPATACTACWARARASW